MTNTVLSNGETRGTFGSLRFIARDRNPSHEPASLPFKPTVKLPGDVVIGRTPIPGQSLYKGGE